MITTTFHSQDRILYLHPATKRFVLFSVYAAMGATLGILSGIALATILWPPTSRVGQSDFMSASSSATTLNIRPLANAGPAQSFEQLADKQVSSDLLSLQTPAASKTAVAQQAPVISNEHSARSLSYSTHAGYRKIRIPMPSPYLAGNAADSGLPSAAGEAAKPERALQAFVVTIEGDETVLDYDASDRVLSTYEGQAFVVDKAADEGSAMQLQDFPSSVHYRCNQASGCTLSHAGGVVAHARLRTQADRSRETDAGLPSTDSPLRDLSQLSDSPHASR